MSVADDFIADSHHLCSASRVFGKDRKRVDAVLASLRMELMRTHRFSLDDDFVRLASEVSIRTSPESLLSRLGSALLPYEDTWLEFDPRVKVEVGRLIAGAKDGRGPEGVPPRMGVLLRRDGRRPTAWSALIFSPVTLSSDLRANHYGNLTLPLPSAFLFDSDEVERFEKVGKVWSWRSFFSGANSDLDSTVFGKPERDQLGVIADDMRSLIWGYVLGEGNSNLGEMFGLDKDVSQRDILDRFEEKVTIPGMMAKDTPKFLERHGDVGVSPLSLELVMVAIRNTFPRKGKMDSAFKSWMVNYAECLISQAGFVKFMVTILCMLNEVPIATREVIPRGSRRTGDHFRRELPFSEVTLRLPRVKSAARYVARKVAGGGRKRRHDVISHWRSYVPDEMRLIGDEESKETRLDVVCPIVGDVVPPVRSHAWEYDQEDHLYRTCAKCGTFSRLVKEHLRGDESLGWVSKSYVIKASGGD